MNTEWAPLDKLLACLQQPSSNIRLAASAILLDLLPALTVRERSRVLEAVTYALASEANTDAAAAQVEVIQTLRRIAREVV